MQLYQYLDERSTKGIKSKSAEQLEIKANKFSAGVAWVKKHKPKTEAEGIKKAVKKGVKGEKTGRENQEREGEGGKVQTKGRVKDRGAAKTSLCPTPKTTSLRSKTRQEKARCRSGTLCPNKCIRPLWLWIAIEQINAPNQLPTFNRRGVVMILVVPYRMAMIQFQHNIK
jgi:hypothetical protein